MKLCLTILLLLLVFSLVWLFLTVGCGPDGSIISFLFPSGAVNLFCIAMVIRVLFYKK